MKHKWEKTEHCSEESKCKLGGPRSPVCLGPEEAHRDPKLEGPESTNQEED